MFQDKILVESAHITEIYGPTQALKDYLKNRSKEFLFIAQPFSYTSIKRSKTELYLDGSLETKFSGPKNVGLDPFDYIKDLLYIFISVYRLKKKIDIFIGVDNLNAFVGIWLRRFGKAKKVIYYVIDYTPKRFTNHLLNLVYHRIDRFCIRHANYIWNLSERMVSLRRKQGVPKEKNMVVPVGVELEKIKQASLNLSKRETIVIMSHLTKSKGIQLAIDSMNEIVQKIPEARLIIIGMGPYEEELKRMIKQKKLESSIIFLGTMEHSDLFDFLPKCGIGLATYTSEPNSITYYADPTKPKEYLACGLPVIITKVPWIAEEIDRRPMGIAINYDKEELVNAVVKLLGDDEFYSECRRNAVEFASKLSWDKIYDEAFRKIV